MESGGVIGSSKRTFCLQDRQRVIARKWPLLVQSYEDVLERRLLFFIEEAKRYAFNSIQQLPVSEVALAIALDKLVEIVQARYRCGCMEFIELGVHAEADNLIFLRDAETSHQFQPVSEFVIVRDEVAALETVDEFGGVKRKPFGSPESTNPAPLRRLEGRLHRVEQDRYACLGRQPLQSDGVAAVDGGVRT